MSFIYIIHLCHSFMSDFETCILQLVITTLLFRKINRKANNCDKLLLGWSGCYA